MPDFNDYPQHEPGLLYDVDAITRDLKSTADTWVRKLFPRGRVGDKPSEWRVADISGRAPRNKGSCVINLTGDHAGCWCDWSGGDAAKGKQISTIKEHFALEEG